MGQVVELEPHAVVGVLFERHPADLLYHVTPPRTDVGNVASPEGVGLYPISIMPYRDPRTVWLDDV
jgi:hypothetical protein